MQDHEFLKLIPPLRPLTLHIGLQFFGNADDAEDVAQNTLLRLWAARSHIATTSPLEPLVAKVAKNVCVSMWREKSSHEIPSTFSEKRNNEDIIPGGRHVSMVESSGADPQTLLEEREDAVWLEHRLRALPEYLQRVLRMKQEEGLTTEQIAEILATDTHSVQTLISKARRQLMIDLRRRYRNKNLPQQKPR